MTKTKNLDQLKVCVDTVKENVSALETGRALGLEIRHGRCRCPIHHGTDFNCVLYSGNRGFCCHVCKTGGDVIKLAQGAMPDMQFVDVLRWFNATFNLGMSIDSPMSETALESAKKRQKRQAEERAFRERLERMDFDLYLLGMSVLMRLEKLRDDNRPKRYSDEWNDQFCEAVRTIPEVKQFIDDCAMACTVVRK